MARYQFILKKDICYFFEPNNTYYVKRITKMVKLGMIKRNKDVIVLGLLGYEYLRIMNIEINKSIYDANYVERLKNIAHIAAVTHNKQNMEFVSLIELKQCCIC